MAKIDNLIFKAKQNLVGNKEKLEYVILGYERPNHVTCIVWNGVPGQARYLESDHDTREEAIDTIKQVAKEFSNCKRISGFDADGNTMVFVDENEGILVNVDYDED